MHNLGSTPYIIVLGHLMDKNGLINDETSRRVARAAQISEEIMPRAIILCGWAYRSDSNITIADAMKNRLKLIQPNSHTPILTQSLSRDTVGDAFFSRVLLADICKAKQPDIIVVTSEYHVERTRCIFDFIFHGYAKSIDVQGCKLNSENLARLASELDSTAAFRKTFLGVNRGDMDSIHRAMTADHPYYNGCAHPMIRSTESIIDQLHLLGSNT